MPAVGGPERVGRALGARQRPRRQRVQVPDPQQSLAGRVLCGESDGPAIRRDDRYRRSKPWTACEGVILRCVDREPRDGRRFGAPAVPRQAGSERGQRQDRSRSLPRAWRLACCCGGMPPRDRRERPSRPACSARQRDPEFSPYAPSRGIARRSCGCEVGPQPEGRSNRVRS